MAKKKAPEGELIPADTTPQWRVVTEEDDKKMTPPLHRLKYGRRTIEKGTTPGDLRRFHEAAAHFNKRGLAPDSSKAKCRADRNLPAPPKRLPKSVPDSDECDVEPVHGKVISFTQSDT